METCATCETGVEEDGTLCKECLDSEVRDHRINTFERIVERHQYEMIEGLMVDAWSAQAMLTCYRALSPENQRKMGGLSLERYAAFSWEHIHAA